VPQLPDGDVRYRAVGWAGLERSPTSVSTALDARHVRGSHPRRGPCPRQRRLLKRAVGHRK